MPCASRLLQSVLVLACCWWMSENFGMQIFRWIDNVIQFFIFIFIFIYIFFISNRTLELYSLVFQIGPMGHALLLWIMVGMGKLVLIYAFWLTTSWVACQQAPLHHCRPWGLATCLSIGWCWLIPLPSYTPTLYPGVPENPADPQKWQVLTGYLWTLNPECVSDTLKQVHNGAGKIISGIHNVYVVRCREANIYFPSSGWLGGTYEWCGTLACKGVLMCLVSVWCVAWVYAGSMGSWLEAMGTQCGWHIPGTRVGPGGSPNAWA